MKIALVTHFFPPEACAAATRVASLADAFSEAGHDVSVVTTFPSFPAGRFARGDRRVLARVENDARTRIIRLRSILLARFPGRRALHWISAALSATCYLLATRSRYDAIVVSSPPITLALPAVLGALRHRAKLVVDIRDVFPDIAIAMGAWKKRSAAARVCEFVARALYRRADLIVAVTPTALSQIAARGVPATRLMLARNAAESAACAGVERLPSAGFVAIYAGNLGVATDVDVLLDAAAHLRGEEILIEIVGGGAHLSHVQQRVRTEGLENVRVMGSLPRAEAMARIARAHVALIPLRDGIRESVPTKLYDAISVGCLVIVAAGGEAKAEARDLGGFCTPAGDGKALADAIRGLSRLDRFALQILGDLAKYRLQRRDDRQAIMRRYARRVAELVHPSHPAVAR